MVLHHVNYVVQEKLSVIKIFNNTETIEDYTKCHLNETSEDGLFTISEVECLGACSNAPMM